MTETLHEFSSWLLGLLLHQPESLLEFQIAALIKGLVSLIFVALAFGTIMLLESRRSRRRK